jgi:hypothetical protein
MSVELITVHGILYTELRENVVDECTKRLVLDNYRDEMVDATFLIYAIVGQY